MTSDSEERFESIILECPGCRDGTMTRKSLDENFPDRYECATCACWIAADEVIYDVTYDWKVVVHGSAVEVTAEEDIQTLEDYEVMLFNGVPGSSNCFPVSQPNRVGEKDDDQKGLPDSRSGVD